LDETIANGRKMLVLDTDHFSELMRGGKVGRRLGQRILDQEVCTTIITLDEQARGWLARIKQAKDGADLVDAYASFHRLFVVTADWHVLSWDAHAERAFADISRFKRIGTMDLRIASIVIANRYTLLTRNLKDFNQLTELKCEDWLVDRSAV
jgi:tRNA(fMet)-specific endonuclease VapC